MKKHVNSAAFAAIVLIGLSGCVSNSQTFIGPGGTIKNCASTSQDQGITGVFLANSRFNNCVDDIKAHGYIEIENVGSVGIALYAADAKGLKILKVYDNSPAAKAGIVKGDIVNNVNGKVITHRGDFDVVNGVIGTHVEITINRDGVVKTYDLVRAKLAYSRVFEDVVYD